MSTLPPPVPLGDSRVGLSVGGGYIDSIGSSRPRPPGIDLGFAQGAVTFRVGQRIQASVLGSGSGLAHMTGVGVIARYRLDGEEDESALALQLEGGLFWGGVGLVWRREVGPAWVYTAPALLYKDGPWARLPVGAVFRPADGVSLAFETGLTTSSARLRGDYPYGPMAHGYLAASLGVGIGKPKSSR